MDALTPPPGTVERWAWDYVVAADLERKFILEPPPRVFEASPPERRTIRPGRDPRLTISAHAAKSPGRDALRIPARRAQLVHTFLHHELQAAELMCWAILAFPETPEGFRAGLAGIARDEVRHMLMYRAHLVTLGHAYGDFPVRDWFWERIPSSPTPIHFVATLGMGFEGANLDHTARFAERFRAAGDERGARLQEKVGDEEVPHIRFALHWFEHWTGGTDFATWVAHLPAPLSPILMRGAPIERAERRRAGFSENFLDRLTQWRDLESGS